MKEQSLYNEIMTALESQLDAVKKNRHYPTPARKEAAHYALANAIGTAHSIKESRRYKSVDRKEEGK